MLVDARVDAAALDHAAIVQAVSGGHVDALKVFLADERVDAAAVGPRAVVLAATRCHLPVLQLLLDDPRIDASAGGNAALRSAHVVAVPLLAQSLPVLRVCAAQDGAGLADCWKPPRPRFDATAVVQALAAQA